MVRHPSGFFRSREVLDLDDGYVGDEQPQWAEYRNLGSGAIGAIISAKHATLHELDTVYGVADLYRLAEVIRVDIFNQKLAQRWATRKDGG
jgi:hypothetical protein